MRYPCRVSTYDDKTKKEKDNNTKNTTTQPIHLTKEGSI